MNDKILVEIICPSVSRKWDFRIPSDAKMSEIKNQIISDIRIYEGLEQLFDKTEDISIFNSEGDVLNPDFTASEADISSGDTLLII